MRGRKSLRRISVLALFALLALAAGADAQGDPAGAIYEFEVPVAPVCLDGTYPVTVNALAWRSP